MRLRPVLAALMVLGLTPAAAGAHDYRADTLQIDHPWTRATPPGAATAGAWMNIVNSGDASDRLVGASSSAAESVEIHQMQMDGDVMRMRAVSGGIEIPARSEMVLEPGGYHLMLIGLEAPFAEGARVPLTLDFEGAGTVEVELAVEAPGAAGAGHGMADHGAHGDHGSHGGQR